VTPSPASIAAKKGSAWNALSLPTHTDRGDNRGTCQRATCQRQTFPPSVGPPPGDAPPLTRRVSGRGHNWWGGI
jgi:hypothetical protein